MRSRDEHLEFCKGRAIEYLDRGDGKNACISMLSDLKKHPETCNHGGIFLLEMAIMGKYSPEEIKRTIQGFA